MLVPSLEGTRMGLFNSLIAVIPMEETMIWTFQVDESTPVRILDCLITEKDAANILTESINQWIAHLDAFTEGTGKFCWYCLEHFEGRVIQ